MKINLATKSIKVLCFCGDIKHQPACEKKSHTGRCFISPTRLVSHTGWCFISPTRLSGALRLECAWGGTPGVGLGPRPAYLAIRVRISIRGGGWRCYAGCGRGCVGGGVLRARGDCLSEVDRNNLTRIVVRMFAQVIY